jgi:hypothetical protein
LKRRAGASGFASTISPGTLLGTSLVNPNNTGSAPGQKSLLGA